MAANKGRNKSTRKTSGTSRKNTGKNVQRKGNNASQTRQQESAGGLLFDVILLITLALAVLLFISILGFGGLVGGAVRNALFGTVGVMAYTVPVLVFIGIAFLISNRRSSQLFRKILAGLLLFLSLCGLIQSLTDGYLASNTFADYFDRSALYHTGGGIVGGTICHFVTSAFGVIGGNVILSVVVLIALVLLTQRSFFGFLLRIGRRIGSWISDGKERYEEGQPERELRRELRDQQSKKRREERRARRMQELEEALAEEEGDEYEETEEERGSGKLPGFLDGTWLKEDADSSGQLSFIPIKETPAKEKKTRKTAVKKETTGKKAAAAEAEPAEAAPLVIHRPEPEVMPEEIEEDAGWMEEEEISPVREDEKNRRSAQKNPKSSKEEIENGIENVRKEIKAQEAAPQKVYHYPPLKLLRRGDGKSKGDSDAHLKATAQKLQDTLYNFGVNATVTNVSCGPSVTRYELQPEMGVKVSRIVGLADDIKLNLATPDIRIEAPIPGKAAVGIEVPNKENSPVMLRDLLESQEFQNAKSKISFAAGKDIAGKPVVADIAKMPHVLIAGATGSGKSVCINTLIISILYKASPEEVKLIMIDPKVVELSVYNGIPHLFIPVVTDPKKAAGALNWAVTEMGTRYNTFAEFHVRNLEEYNRKVENMRVPEGEERPQKMPQIVIIVDELADLMMVAPGEVEDAICRLAQLARAAGIHLVIATQRPSVNVITGLIKANMPSRIAFAVTSGVDSRTILDMNGAEKLLGKGDMLFYPQGYQKPARLQGSFVSDEEVSDVVRYLTDKNPAAAYDSRIEEQVNTSSGAGGFGRDEERDVYFEEAGKFIIEKEKASIGSLQRLFKIGFNRAARIMDQLCDAGVVGPEEGTKPRKVLMTMEEFQAFLEE